MSAGVPDAAAEALLERLRRSSGLRLDRDCHWTIHGEPITHARTLEVLDRGLSVRDDGQVVVRVGAQWAYVEVEDTPWCVRNVRPIGDPARPEALELALTDGTTERLDPATLVLRGDADLRCRLRGGWARFLRPAWHALEPLLEPADAPGVAARLHLGGAAVPIPPDSGAPGAPGEPGDDGA